MQKTFAFFLFLIIFAFFITGCTQSQQPNSSNTSTTNDTSTPTNEVSPITTNEAIPIPIIYHANCVLLDPLTVTYDVFGDIKFLGEIKNTGNRIANYVKITFTLKNSAGAVIETPYTYVNNTDIPAGGTDSFTCWTYTLSSEVASYTYLIRWSEY